MLRLLSEARHVAGAAGIDGSGGTAAGRGKPPSQPPATAPSESNAPMVRAGDVRVEGGRGNHVAHITELRARVWMTAFLIMLGRWHQLH